LTFTRDGPIISLVELGFREEANGELNADLGASWPGFNATLADSISAVPPRGAKESGFSTYWIDRALREVERHRGDSGVVQLQSGNLTSLWILGDKVVARSDYELFDEEVMPADEFLAVLREWRSAVITAQDTAPAHFAETYRRNPYPD
jgi:hypothetical protein